MDKISNFDKNKELVKEIIKLTLKNKKKKIKKLENERKLSEILNVKRSKIRNALLIVESKGYIKRKPGSGTFINYNLGENNIEDINIKISIVGSFEVNDWAHWKSSFDNHVGAREKAGIKTIYVGNEIDNPNKVHIVLETPEADTMQKFMQQPENQEVIKNSGHKQETSIMIVCSD